MASTPMNLIKKILIAHQDPKMRRRLVMLFSAAGFDVRSFGTIPDALKGAQAEWFDLALVDEGIPGTSAADLTTGLRQIQPTLQQLLLVGKMELGEVVRGIRQGVAEVVAVADDPMPVLRQALAFFRIEDPQGLVTTIDSGEIASLEAGLAGVEQSGRVAGAGGDLETRVLQLIRQNEALTAGVTRLQEEKSGLVAEIRTMVLQAMDSQRLQVDLENIRQERELAAATQQAIDEKARALAELRVNIASERSALECERQRAAKATPPGSRTEAELSQARAELTDWRRRLEQQDDVLAGEAARVRHESLQLARERRRWHDDLEMIRAQEANLRGYEGRLREMQAVLEAESVKLITAVPSAGRAKEGTDEPALREAWAKLQRTGEILEAERKNFVDDRLNFREQERAIRQREEKLKDRELRQTMREKAVQMQAAAPVPSKAARIAKAPGSMLSRLLRA